MPDPDYKALCAELADSVELLLEMRSNDRPMQVTEDRLNRAPAALAQPDPQEPGPTDEELLGIEDLEAAWNAQADAFNSWDELGIDEIVWWAQRQALARWGRPAIEPVPVSEGLPGPEDCDAEGRCWLLTVEDDYPQWRLHSIQGAQPGGYMIWVPVDSDGAMVDCFYTSHWLPANALPVPSSNFTNIEEK